MASIRLKRRGEMLYKKYISKKTFKLFGHEFFFLMKGIFTFPKGANFIEIGSERGAGSTNQLAKWANSKGWNFITVDVNPDTVNDAREIVTKVNSNYQAVCEYGEKFLAAFEGQIDICYLDAFDVPGPWNSPERIAAYEGRGEELSWENCWKMHYDCCVALIDKMPVGGIIVFDDVYPLDENDVKIESPVDKKYSKWAGKGTTAIPLLIDNGFDIIAYRPNGAVFKRVSKS